MQAASEVNNNNSKSTIDKNSHLLSSADDGELGLRDNRRVSGLESLRNTKVGGGNQKRMQYDTRKSMSGVHLDDFKDVDEFD